LIPREDEARCLLDETVLGLEKAGEAPRENRADRTGNSSRK